MTRNAFFFLLKHFDILPEQLAESASGSRIIQSSTTNIWMSMESMIFDFYPLYTRSNSGYSGFVGSHFASSSIPAKLRYCYGNQNTQNDYYEYKLY